MNISNVIAKLCGILICLSIYTMTLGFSSTQVSAQRVSTVRVEPVKTKPFSQTVSIIGRLVATRSGKIAARIEGPIEKILEIGDRVEKEGVIAQLNPDILKTDYQFAESELAESRADLLNYRAEQELAETEFARQKGLDKSAAFSIARFQDAQKKVAIAAARVRRAEARVQVKLANLNRKKIQLGYASIRAPYSGIVVQRFTEIGSYVRSGDPIAKIIGETSLELEAEVPFNRIGGISDGALVGFSLDDGSEHRATVRAILPSENQLTRTRTVRMVPDFNDKKHDLAEGQSATIRIPIGPVRPILVVHKDAIVKRNGTSIVFVVQENKAKSRSLILGESVGSYIEVLDGVKEGEQVVIRGNERLRPGAKVRLDKSAS